MNRTLLVIDDDPLVRMTLRRALRDPDFEIVEASSAEEACEILLATEVKVVLCDHHLRGECGTSFLGKLERLHPEIARILLTGDTSRDVFIAAVDEANARRVLYKPWNNDQLRDVVRQCFGLSRRATVPSPGRYDGAGTLRRMPRSQTGR